MVDLRSLSGDTPIPPAPASDVRRVWESMRGHLASDAARETAIWDIQIVANLCSEGADPAAVFFRAALIWPLLENGLPDGWRDGDRPHESVFQRLADYPLAEGIQSFRPDEFVAALSHPA